MNTEIKIIEKIKTFEDACQQLGLTVYVPIVGYLPEKDRKSIVAYYKLIIIVRALNEGWEPDFTNCNQPKYWNWFYLDSSSTEGFGSVSAHSAASNIYSYVGSRLCFKTREIAMYARKQFRDLYFEYLFIEMPKNYGK